VGKNEEAEMKPPDGRSHFSLFGILVETMEIKPRLSLQPPSQFSVARPLTPTLEALEFWPCVVHFHPGIKLGLPFNG
jgi:hypothetical protein